MPVSCSLARTSTSDESMGATSAINAAATGSAASAERKGEAHAAEVLVPNAIAA
jgi:hypothetical protein